LHFTLATQAGQLHPPEHFFTAAVIPLFATRVLTKAAPGAVKALAIGAERRQAARARAAVVNFMMS